MLQISSIQVLVSLTYLAAFSLPSLTESEARTRGTWNVRLEESRNSTIHSVVTKTLVPSTMAATRYAPLASAMMPAAMESSPPASTSVTISMMAIQVDFEGFTPFLCR